MKETSLQQLTIEHLRGAVKPFTLTFEKGKKLTVIYGENGTGKSTICDAFEFLGKGKIGSLENRGLGRTNRYWNSLGKKPSDVSVCLEADSCSFRAKINKNGVIASPSANQPRVEVLRRSQILSLIEAKPAERYAAVSRFVDVSGVENSEAALREMIRDSIAAQKVAEARVQENEDEIRRYWEIAGKPTPDPFAWAASETAPGTGSFESEINSIRGLQSACERLTDYPGRVKAAEGELKSALNTEASAKRHVHESLKTVSRDAEETVAVLEAASAYLAKVPSPPFCPLCESLEKVTGLAERTAGRLRSFSELQASQARVKVSGQLVAEAKQQLKIIRQSAKKHLSEFKKCLREFEWSSDIPAPRSPLPEDESSLEEWLTANAHLMHKWKSHEQALQDKEMFTANLMMALKTWQTNLESRNILDRLVPRLSRTLEIITEERRRFTDQILSSIAKEVGRLYEMVHPGEGLNKVNLELDPKKRASLEIEASFCGERAAPQAYFSESHLDTLGLCIFLALAAMDRVEETILVLDDVLANVDDRHMGRVLEMLCSEMKRFRHCVVATHHRDWKDRWRNSKGVQCQVVELSDWSVDDGIRTGSPAGNRL